MTRLAPCAGLRAAAAAIWLFAPAVQAQQNSPPNPQTTTPDATITFRGRTASIGAGFSWGAATLQFQGKTYPVRVDGFVLGGLGTASLEYKGEVFGLTKAEDLNGNFTAASSNLAIGRGRGSVTMRNDKGVRVVMSGDASGLQVGFGPRGITLTIGEAGGPPADAGFRLPQTLGFGETKLGPLFLKPTLNAQVYGAQGTNPGFDGKWSFGPVDNAENWLEHSNEVGLNGRYPVGAEGEYGTVQGRVSGVYSLTTFGPDGPSCTGHHTNQAYTLENANLGWKSGDLLPALGHNAIEVSGGNQNYQVGDGLIFWDGGQDCVGRGANWLSPRKAFEDTGIVRLNLKNWTFEGVHLKYNDHDPATDTRLVAGRAEYATDHSYVEHLKLGFQYFRIYHSDNPARDKMDGIYIYQEVAPLHVLPDLSFKGSFVQEGNSKKSGLEKTAYAWNMGPAYQFSNLPWKPKVSYRYASFSGGDNTFDPLFGGLPDWGTWFQGELLGEFVLSNSNLLSHQVRVTLTPTDILTINFIYYRFMLDNREQSFGVTPSRVNHALADEGDLIFDLALTNWWSITTAFTVAKPNDGFKEAVNGKSTWVNGYLYMNFNF